MELINLPPVGEEASGPNGLGLRVLEGLAWWGLGENRPHKQLSKKAEPAYIIAELTSLSACPLRVRNHLRSLEPENQSQEVAQPLGHFQT